MRTSCILNCEGDNIAEFLKENLQNVSKKKERKLCLTIAEFCGRGRIRGIHVIGNKYDCGTFTAEIEVGTRKDCANSHWKPYFEKGDILNEDLGDGVTIRLCEGDIGGHFS